MTHDEFKVALANFVLSTTQSMKYAEVCAMAGLEHFAEHGNTVYCQEFLDAMPRNFVRRGAYLQWLVAHAPIKLQDKKLKKDQDNPVWATDAAKEAALIAAAKKPFWDFAPEKEIVDFDAATIFEALFKTIERFENTKRYHASNDEAKASLAAAKAALVELAEPKAQAA